MTSIHRHVEGADRPRARTVVEPWHDGTSGARQDRPASPRMAVERFAAHRRTGPSEEEPALLVDRLTPKLPQRRSR
ncbi:hypothetical protein [Amycolatopsis tolypomycina]|uniref:hypothetical protein n=1 Tax=Amycolatopsis tolypomycina TaxID=208445 RepID=UPI0033BCFF28